MSDERTEENAPRVNIRVDAPVTEVVTVNTEDGATATSVTSETVIVQRGARRDRRRAR